MIRLLRSSYIPSHGVFVSVLALWMSLAVPAAMSATAPSSAIWSIQLHGGMFAPTEASATGPMAGMRYCKHYSPYLQGGLLTGWTLMSRSLEQPADSPPSFGPQVELARVDAHLVPVMGFLQVNLTEKSWLVPFLGIGAGYEWLILDARDHRTGVRAQRTYANVAWETYGGIGLRLRSGVRLNGEVYYNGGSLERDVTDASGRPFFEAIHVNGVGARVGLDLEFE
jgi:hypothetical protein